MNVNAQGWSADEILDRVSASIWIQKIVWRKSGSASDSRFQLQGGPGFSFVKVTVDVDLDLDVLVKMIKLVDISAQNCHPHA